MRKREFTTPNHLTHSSLNTASNRILNLYVKNQCIRRHARSQEHNGENPQESRTTATSNYTINLMLNKDMLRSREHDQGIGCYNNKSLRNRNTNLSQSGMRTQTDTITNSIQLLVRPNLKCPGPCVLFIIL